MTTKLPPSWILELRERLEAPPPKRLPTREVRQAAVLVPLYVDAGQLWVLLTRRSEEVPQHKSQIAFPGGALELGETPWQAALREAREEIGLEPEKVLPLGLLDEASTPSGYHIIPCVGAVPYPLETRIQRAEIAEVFAIPLTAFANPQLVEQRRVEIDGVPREITMFHVGRHRIWGLTARILYVLLGRLGVSPA